MHMGLRMDIRTLSPFSAMDQVDSLKSANAELAKIGVEQFGRKGDRKQRKEERKVACD